MKYLLLFVGFISSLAGYSQPPRVINYPFDLIYEVKLRDCLGVLGPISKDWKEKLKKSFVSTVEFRQRFLCLHFYKMMEFYSQPDKPLWQIDREVASYFDSLEKADTGLMNETEEKESPNRNPPLSEEFRQLVAQRLGKQVYFDYSKINRRSLSLSRDLARLGLRKEEIEQFRRLLWEAQNRPKR